MPAHADLEDLKAVYDDIGQYKVEHPDGYGDLVALLTAHRKVGWKNICRMFLGDTPEKLKGVE